MKIIPYARHLVTEEDIEAVVKVLRSDRLAQGHIVTEFEEAVAKYVGTKYAVACANGSNALEMMYRSVGVGPDTTVYVPAMSYVATANSAKILGAKIVFYGSELLDINESVSAPAPKLVVRMHYGGKQSNLQTDLPMVDDSCHSMTHDPKALASAFSFHPTKFITTAGEGGMVVTNDEKIYRDCLAIRDNGRVNNRTIMLGGNYRMSESAAAMGLSQLKRMPEIMEKRKHIAELYDRLLEPLTVFKESTDGKIITAEVTNFHGPVTLPDTDKNQLHLYPILCERRDELQAHLKEKGIEAQINYIPIYRHPYWAKMGYNPIPSAEEWHEHCLSLPIHPSVSDEDVEYIVKCIKEFYA